MKSFASRILGGLVAAAVTGVFLSGFSTVYAQGVMLRAIGPINESMGGAAIAAPLDSAGAIYHNPASIAALRDNEVSLGLGIIIPHSQVASQIDGMPGTYGKAFSEAGELPAPTMSTVFRTKEKSRFTFGVAIAGVGGAAALYSAPQSAMVNPILQGQARASNVQVFEIMPTVSYNVSDKLAIGFTPVVGLASLSINPMPFGLDHTSPLHNYGTRYTWAGGFNIGTYYDFQNHWRTGFTFKSPLWADPLHFTGTHISAGTDGAGNPTVIYTPQDVRFNFNLPMILGWGISYDGIKRTVIALDIRYFDYENTAGFGGPLASDGTVDGLGWSNVLSVSMGVQYKLTEKLAVRMGYCWNENPIPESSQPANISAPLFMQNVIALGATYTFLKDFDISFAWSHAFQTYCTGKFDTPLGPDTGTVTNSVSADTLLLGLTKRF